MVGPILSTEAPNKRSRKGRPNNPIEFRRQLAQRACEPGVSVAGLAMEHGLNTYLLFKWRRAYRAGEYESGALMPVALVEDSTTRINARPSTPNASSSERTPAGTIEVSIGAARVRIEGTPDPDTLRLVLRSLSVQGTA